MDNIVDVIKKMPDYIGSNGRSETEIDQAEKELGVIFAKDYREYLEKIGLACYDGHELTGLTKSDRLNVVSVTKEQREKLGEEVSSWYVVEEANIYGIIIWQSQEGFIYQTAPNTITMKVAESLYEYFKKYYLECEL